MFHLLLVPSIGQVDTRDRTNGSIQRKARNEQMAMDEHGLFVRVVV
jgi:hypothetical protein